MPVDVMSIGSDYERRLAVERTLADGFPQLVGAVSLADVVVLARGAEKVPQFIKDCRLVAITNANYPNDPDSSERIHNGDLRCEAIVDDEVRADKSFGIGFAYKNRVTGFSSAHVPSPADGLTDISIAQFQGRRVKRYQAGLYGGIDWKQTLLQAWLAVAHQTPAHTIGVESGWRSIWANSVGYLIAQNDPKLAGQALTREEYHALGAVRLATILDQTALDAGFTPRPEDMYWELSLRN